MTDFLNPIAELDQPDSGNLVDPDIAYQLKNQHRFYCPDYDCKDPERILFVKNSVNGNLFFSHRGNCGHDIKPETLLHKSAIEWFLDKEEYEIPPVSLKNGRVLQQKVKLDLLKTECEFRQLEKIVPDVKLSTHKAFHFAIEVVVTNDISVKKIQLMEEFQLPTIRVDLTSFYKTNKKRCQEDYNFIQRHLTNLLTDNNLKQWVVYPDEEQVTDKLEFRKDKSSSGWLPFLAVLGTVLIFKKLIFDRK